MEANQRMLNRYIAIGALVLLAGLVISFRARGTWWLLLMAALAWAQSRVLRREITTSGLPLRLFNTISWALLGFAITSLLPDPARIIGDVVVLLVAVGAFIHTRLRRVR
jgi:hypothetical protein